MPRIEYQKLVRDRIPEIIEADGRTCGLETMNDDEFLAALLEKLIEEAQEAAGSNSEDRVKELADLLEVVDTLLELEGIERPALEKVQAERRVNRGGFENRLRLLWTE